VREQIEGAARGYDEVVFARELVGMTFQNSEYSGQNRRPTP